MAKEKPGKKHVSGSKKTDVSDFIIEVKGESSPVPPQMRTPITAAETIISQLAEIWGEITPDADSLGRKDGYNELIFGPMFSDEHTKGDQGVALQDELLEKRPREAKKFALLLRLLIATAYAVQAIKTAKATPRSLHSPEAWGHVADAMYWHGFTQATWSMKKGAKSFSSAFALKGADARHATHRAYREQVVAAYKNGNYKSKNNAAEQLAGKVVPLTYQVVRDYLKGI